MLKKNFVCLAIRKGYSETQEMSSRSGIQMAQRSYVYTFLKDE